MITKRSAYNKADWAKIYPSILFPLFKCGLPATKIWKNLGSVSAKTNENSSNKYNSLKSLRHGGEKIVRTRHVSQTC